MERIPSPDDFSEVSEKNLKRLDVEARLALDKFIKAFREKASVEYRIDGMVFVDFPYLESGVREVFMKLATIEFEEAGWEVYDGGSHLGFSKKKQLQRMTPSWQVKFY